MRISQEVIDRIRESTDIVSLISSYVDLKGSGNRYVGLCPFHKESTPSFNVSADKQLYHCFGCGASGNSISFIMQIENFEFIDALKHLADQNNIQIETTDEDYEKRKKEKELLIEMNTKAARFFYKNLYTEQGKDALDYIYNRKISEQMQRKFGLGYATKSFDDLYNFLVNEGYSDDLILQSGLVTEKNGKRYDKFINRVMFPIFDVYGKVVAFGGRILGEGMPKYLNSPETKVFNKSSVLYNLNYAKNEKGRHLILVEGYMDALMLYQWGIRNVVAVLGTAFNENHVRTLRKYCDKVFLLFDNDEAGVKAVKRAIPYIVENGLKVRVVQLNDAKDPDEYIQKFGREKFVNILKNSVDNIVFEIEELYKVYDTDLPDERLDFINEVIKLLNSLNNDIERQIYLEKVSEISKIDINLIKKQLKSNDTYSEMSKKKMYIRNTAKATLPKNVTSAIIDIVNLMSYNKQYAIELMEILKPHYILDEQYKKLFEIIYDLHSNNKDVVVNSLEDFFETIEEKSKISKLFMTYYDYEENQTRKIITDGLKTIFNYYVDVRSAETTDITEVVKLNNIKSKILTLDF